MVLAEIHNSNQPSPVPWANGKASLRKVEGRNDLRGSRGGRIILGELGEKLEEGPEGARDVQAGLMGSMRGESRSEREVRELRQRLSVLEDIESEAESLRSALSHVSKERDYYVSCHLAASNDVMHHASELEILQEALKVLQREHTETLKGKEFAELESKAARTAMQDAKKATEEEMKDLRVLVERLTSERDATILELEATKQDLSDVLAREAQQEDSTKALFAAQKDLEAAYADTVAQLEAWKGEGASLEEDEEEDEDGDEEETDADGLTAITTTVKKEGESAEVAESVTNPNSTLDEYDVIDLENDLSSISDQPMMLNKVRRLPAFKLRLQALMRPTSRSDSQDSQAVKLFAVKELEDDLEELRLLLVHLVERINATAPHKLKRLKRLQQEVNEVLDTLRLTATKLKAVRSFTN